MEKLYLKDLAKDIGIRTLTLHCWLQRYTITKFVFYDKTNTTKPKICVKGCRDFYINFVSFLNTRRNIKYLTNFQEKYNYLLDK